VTQRQPLTTSHKQTDAQPVSKQQLLWKDYPLVLLLSMTSYGTEYPPGQLRSAVLAVTAPSLLPTPSLLTGRAKQDTETALTLCKHCSAIPKTLVCYSVSVTNQKHHTTWAAMKKIYSIPARPSTLYLQ